MSPYSWDNYLNVLEAKITQLSSSPLVNGLSFSGFDNSVRFRANKSDLYGSNIGGTRFTKEFRTNAPTIEYQVPHFNNNR